jgi:tetratricopeptide (TPR) repeat protein
MAKIGRNEPCPCGSGNKYKRCCLSRDEAAAAEHAAAAQRAAVQRFAALAAGFDDLNDGLDEASNRVVDLIDAHRLDEAEQAAHDLLRRYPDIVDGLERLAMVYRARGDRPRAAEYYRKAADFLRDHPEDFDSRTEAYLRAQADELSRPPSA